MQNAFDMFMNSLKETHFSLGDFVDFKKVEENIAPIEINLTQLNYLIGKTDIQAAVDRLWKENPKAFSVLGILIAVRDKGSKALNDNVAVSIDSFSDNPQSIVTFLRQTGLADLLQQKRITNLVDYVFGVEVGLDSNARKNRSGKIMERFVASIFLQNDIAFSEQVSVRKLPLVKKVFGNDRKKFDFVIPSSATTYVIECNFYARNGSKLTETARAYIDMNRKVNNVPGYTFVWITDGCGWNTAANTLKEAFNSIHNIYSLSTIDKFIENIVQ